MYEEGGVRACEIETVTLACIPTAPRPRPPWTWSGWLSRRTYAGAVVRDRLAA
jgi:hypothetical protein